MLVVLKSLKAKPFTNDDGDQIPYFWYKALRSTDDVTITFGSKRGDLPLNQELSLNIEKYEGEGGKFRYRHVEEVPLM